MASDQSGSINSKLTESSTSCSVQSDLVPLFPSVNKKARSRAPKGYFNAPRPDLATFTRIPEFSGFGNERDGEPMETVFKNNQGFDPTCGTSVGGYFCGDGSEHINNNTNSNTRREKTDPPNNAGRTNLDENKITSKYKTYLGRVAPRILGTILPIQNIGKFREEVEKESNFLVSAVKLGTHVFKACWELAAVFFSEDVKANEDIVKLNGYTIKTYGDAVSLESIHLNMGSLKFRVKVNLVRASNGLEPEVLLEDSKWVMIFEKSQDEFIEVSVPLGINTAQIIYEGPVNGLIIIDCP